MRDLCGGIRYRGAKDGVVLSLTDSRNQFCRKHLAWRWNATLDEKKSARRYFSGDPKSATKQDCGKLGFQACIELFMPAVCSAKNVSAPGSNACFAEIALKAELCEQGYDMSQLSEDEIICTAKSPLVCPVFDCVAPPAGCHYGAPFPVDENGCSTSCGTLVCDSAKE